MPHSGPTFYDSTVEIKGGSCILGRLGSREAGGLRSTGRLEALVGHFLRQEISPHLISEAPFKGRRQIKRDANQLASRETLVDDAVPTESAVGLMPSGKT